MKLPLQFLVALLLLGFSIKVDGRLFFSSKESIETSSSSTVASTSTASTSSSEGGLLEVVDGEQSISPEPNQCPSEPTSVFDGARGLAKVPGKVINKSKRTIVCRPEDTPPPTINVPPGGKADIDGIMLTNGQIYKIVNGCTVTINPPGMTTADLSVDCDSLWNSCRQAAGGGVVDNWRRE